MPNLTERIQLELGRNERWQDDVVISCKPRQLAIGTVVRVESKNTPFYKKVNAALRKRLDPRRY